MIRPATHADVGACRVVERAAGAAFRDAGLPEIAEHEPMSAEGMRAACDARRARVAEVEGSLAGYVLAEVVDGCAHVEQISVAPDHQGTGLGRALLAQVGGWAREQGMPAVTLTTFRDVPWNAPLYAHLGYEVVDNPSPGLRAVVAHESELGLDPAIRVVMRRAL